MKIINRIKQYLDYKGIKPTPFEGNIGVSAGYLKKMEDRNSDVGESVILSVVEYCPDINADWLIFGKGNMLKSESTSRNIISDEDFTNIPIYDDISAAAGCGGAFNSDYHNVNNSIRLPRSMARSGKYECIKIKGRSMQPTLLDGGYIVCRELNKSEWAISPMVWSMS